MHLYRERRRGSFVAHEQAQQIYASYYVQHAQDRGETPPDFEQCFEEVDAASELQSIALNLLLSLESVRYIAYATGQCGYLAELGLEEDETVYIVSAACESGDYILRGKVGAYDVHKTFYDKKNFRSFLETAGIQKAYVDDLDSYTG